MEGHLSMDVLLENFLRGGEGGREKERDIQSASCAPHYYMYTIHVHIFNHTSTVECYEYMHTQGHAHTIGEFLIVNCEFFPTFAINRLTNINVHVYYDMVWGRPS